MNKDKLLEKLATALMKVKSMEERGYLSYCGMHTTGQMVDSALSEYQEFIRQSNQKPEVDTRGPAIEGHVIAVIRSIEEEG